MRPQLQAREPTDEAERRSLLLSDAPLRPRQRVVIVGTTGAGKTTLAHALAAKLGAAHIELDALYWRAGWTPAPDFAAQLERALETERWVVDGNYSEVQPLILARADTVIWLDYSFGTKFWRLFKRTCRRVLTREALWDGNTETFRQAFFSRESILVWFFKTHWRQRRRYETRFATLPAHLTLLRLSSPSEAERLLRA
jgi:adenylate kinase family enzyme